MNRALEAVSDDEGEGGEGNERANGIERWGNAMSDLDLRIRNINSARKQQTNQTNFDRFVQRYNLNNFDRYQRNNLINDHNISENQKNKVNINIYKQPA